MLPYAYKVRLGVAGILLMAAGLPAAAAPGLGTPPAKGNISIQAPKGWSVSAGAGDVVLVALAPQVDKDSTGQFQARLSVSQDQGSKLDGAATQALLSNTCQGYRVIQAPSAVAVGGLQGIVLEGTYRDAKGELHTRLYMFVANNQIYTVVFTSLNSSWASYQAAIQSSVATLTVKK